VLFAAPKLAPLNVVSPLGDIVVLKAKSVKLVLLNFTDFVHHLFGIVCNDVVTNNAERGGGFSAINY